MRKTSKYLAATLLVSVLVVAFSIYLSYLQTENGTFIQDTDVIIFSDTACLECNHYVDNVLLPTLNSHNITEQKLIDIGTKDGRVIYNDFLDKHRIPLDLRAKPTASIRNNWFISGYLPQDKLSEFLFAVQNVSQKLLIKYDSTINPDTYRIWDLSGQWQEYSITEPIDTYLQWLKIHPGTPPPTEPGPETLIPLVIAGGLIDGINPCAFAVILFLITLLFSSKMEPGEIRDAGICYTAVVFVVYFLIGIALFETIKVTGIQIYVMAIAAGAIVILGIINIRDSLRKDGEPLIKIPEKSKKRISEIARKASVPAAISLGIFVSFTELACTGAIYVAIISMLSSAATYIEGVTLLILYNIMFIVPLLIVVFLASNGSIAAEMVKWREDQKKKMRLSLGVGMVLLGVWTVAMRFSQPALLLTSALLVVDLVFAVYIFLSVRRAHTF